MKLLVTCLFYFNALVLAAQAWPRHPKTGKIEFQGLLPWPAGIVTDSARRVLIGKWFAHKVRAWPPVVEGTEAPYSPAHWPSPIPLHLQHIEPPGLLVQLRYTVYLTESKAGLAYRFTDFFCLRTRGRDVDAGPIVPLEELLTTSSRPVAGQASLALFRRRLAEATVHW